MDLKISTLKNNQYKFSFKKVTDTKPANLEKTPKADTFEMSIGYVNDIHGQTNNMMRILTGIKGDLRLSAGDNDIGDEKNKAVHKATTKFLNLAGIKASALGNHEFDTKQNDFIQTVKDFDGDILTANFNQEALEKQVKSIKNLNLNIAGSLDKDIISIWSGKEPRYIHMSTQVRSATVPTAEIAIESLEPKTILESAQNLINKHLNSKFYKETIESESKQNLFTRFLNRIKSFKQ